MSSELPELIRALHKDISSPELADMEDDAQWRLVCLRIEELRRQLRLWKFNSKTERKTANGDLLTLACKTYEKRAESLMCRGDLGRT